MQQKSILKRIDVEILDLLCYNIHNIQVIKYSDNSVKGCRSSVKIEQLEQLIRIVESGSMNTAAKDMYIARSSISTSMKNLEEELGGQIFSRHSNGVSLTPFGATVYNHAREICGRVHFLRGMSSNEERVHLHIASMYCSMANDAFASFLRLHTEECLNASIEEVSAHKVIDMVRAGISEIGVLTLFSDTEEFTIRKLENENLEFHEITQRQLGAVVGPSNPLYHSDCKDLELQDLNGYPHLENYATPTDHAWEHRVLKEDSTQGRYVVSDLGLALRLISETSAVMIDARDDEIYRGFYAQFNYRFIPIRDYPKCRTGWIKHRALTLSELAEEYIRILTDRAKSVD